MTSKQTYLILRAFIVLSFLIINQSLYAQNALTRKIIWENDCCGTDFHSETSLPTLNFPGSIYDQENGLLPIYYEEFETSQQSEILFTLTNFTYEELTELEVKCMGEDISKLKNDITSYKDIVYHKKKSFTSLKFLPLRINSMTGKPEKITGFDIIINSSPSAISNLKSKKTYASESVLSKGNWHRISIQTTGIHKVTYNELLSAGLSLPVQSSRIRLFGNGGAMLPEKNDIFCYDDPQENAIWVEDGGDGMFGPGDYFLFYGEGTTTWKYDTVSKKFIHSNHLYSDINFYFLTTDNGDGKRIETKPQTNLPITDYADTFNDYAVHNNDSLNLIKSGKIWYGEKFDILTSRTFKFNFPNIVSGSKAHLNFDVAASSPYSSSFVFNAWGTPFTLQVLPISSGYNTDFAKGAKDTVSIIVGSNPLTVGVTYNKPTNASIGWLNYIELNVIRQIVLNNGHLLFRNIETIGNGRITEFTLSAANATTKVWDITDPLNIELIQGTLNGNNYVFTASSDSLREYAAFDGTGFKSISGITSVTNQNLHGLSNFDMIIVTWPEFISEALRLGNYHTVKSGMSVLVVFPQTIYNEFSSGKQDISAIRNFMKMFYDRASGINDMPKYLLLFGDGSFDPKNRISDNTNLIPSFQSLNSLQPVASYVSDDFFGLLDDGEGYECNGSLDVGIGRFPVNTIEQAKDMVDKVIRYSDNIINSPETTGCNTFSGGIQSLGDWRNIICFIADDEDNNLHFIQAEALASIVAATNPIINIDKIYLDAYKQQSFSGGQRYPEVNDAINKRVERGALIINYTGHGGEVGWGHERILELSDINKWNNSNNLPVFVTATCEFSRFDDPVRTSAGEQVLLNKKGGGIALFSTTRLAFSNSNFNLNKSFYNHVFNKNNGEYLRMGDVIRLSKVANGSNLNIRNFLLLGDPALAIAFPKFNVITTSVPDTMKALSLVSVAGYVADDYGNKLDNFNGIIWPTVYDKASLATTLGNDPGSYPASFSIRKNLIYKGKASVNNGDFSFSFVVPKDIAYQYGQGRISYYAEDGNTDAAGYYSNFVIGGADLSAPVDITGPKIDLFMNDTLFVFGGLTDENPVLLAYISDFSGVNTVGNGIGHDIVAVLDGNTEKSFVLNDYYEADLNTYKSGVIKFPFSNLSEGLHTLRLKVWDVYNNSSEAYTEFFVATENSMVIKRVITYPNPFSDFISFVFEHNQPCCDLDINIQIYSLTGQLVKTISRSVATEGYRTTPVKWNGLSDDGIMTGQGFYIYRLTVKNKEGSMQQSSGKIILIR